MRWNEVEGKWEYNIMYLHKGGLLGGLEGATRRSYCHTRQGISQPTALIFPELI